MATLLSTVPAEHTCRKCSAGSHFLEDLPGCKEEQPTSNFWERDPLSDTVRVPEPPTWEIRGFIQQLDQTFAGNRKMEACGRKTVGSSLASGAWASPLVPAPLELSPARCGVSPSLVSGEAEGRR